MLCFGARRFRCPACRATATALPDDVLPTLAHDVDTVADVVAAYLDGDAPYRRLTTAVLGTPRQAITFDAYAEPPYPSPTPSTCFRWIACFAADAGAWWRAAVAVLLERGAYEPVAPPPSVAALGRTDTKRSGLQDAWHAVDAWRHLAESMVGSRERWHQLMRHCPQPPAGIERTRWLLVPVVPP